MTVNTLNITSGPYIGNGLNDTYSYDFRVDNKTQLSVYETDDAGLQTLLVVDSDYTVTGVGNDSGGTVVRTAGNLPTNYTWYIRSNYIENQLTDFSSQGAFFPDIHEAQFDHLTFLVQQLTDKLSRQFALSESIDIDGTFTISQDATDRASQYLAFGPSGDLIIASGTGADAGLRADLASLLLGQGSSLVGVRDAGGYFTGADVETVLQEIPAPGMTFDTPTINTPTINTATAVNLIVNGTLTGTAVARGALAKNTANQSIPNATTTILNFGGEEYDTDSIHDNVTNNSRLTVPAGVTKVRLVANVIFDSNPTGNRQVSILKNGSSAVGLPTHWLGSNPTDLTYINVSSAVVNAVATDYFEIQVVHSAGPPINVTTTSWFSMEIIK